MSLAAGTRNKSAQQVNNTQLMLVGLSLMDSNPKRGRLLDWYDNETLSDSPPCVYRVTKLIWKMKQYYRIKNKHIAIMRPSVSLLISANNHTIFVYWRALADISISPLSLTHSIFLSIYITYCRCGRVIMAVYINYHQSIFQYWQLKSICLWASLYIKYYRNCSNIKLPTHKYI